MVGSAQRTREPRCLVDTSMVFMDTTAWLCWSPALRSVVPPDTSDTNDDDPVSLVTTWLDRMDVAGEVRLKEGTTDRWIVCKVKV